MHVQNTEVGYSLFGANLPVVASQLEHTVLCILSFFFGLMEGLNRATDLSLGTANQYSCFLPCWAYCCMEALALETNVFFIGFPTLRQRNLWLWCFLFSVDIVPADGKKQ